MSEATHTDNPHGRDHGNHGHSHQHDHGHDFSAANEKFFNDQASSYEDKPQAQELSRRISKSMRTTYPALFDEDHTSLLDYACGPGLVSREFSPYVKSIVGVDISQGMVDRFNLRVANQGIPPEEMKAVKAELKGNDLELDGAKFDVIICVAAYHHFPNAEETTRILASFLKPGGSILIADFLNEETGKDPLGEFGHVVAHTSGFSEGLMKKFFDSAGLVEFEFTIAIPSVRLHEAEVQIFLAKGVRPLGGFKN